jgi:hypothetical protein
MPARFFVAQFETALVSKPTHGALHHVARTPQAAAVGMLHFCQKRLHSAFYGAGDVMGGTVSRVTVKSFRSGARSASRALNLGDRIEQPQGRNAVGYVRGTCLHHQGDAVGVGNHMLFAAFFPAIRGIRACVVPPKTARTDWLSITARERSSSPDFPRALSRRWCTLSQTPSLVQSRNRRQHVTPLPLPNSSGNMRQGAPVRRMNTIPVSAARFAMAGLPPFGFGAGTGNSGSTSCQSESGTRLNAMHCGLQAWHYNRHFWRLTLEVLKQLLKPETQSPLWR